MISNDNGFILNVYFFLSCSQIVKVMDIYFFKRSQLFELVILQTVMYSHSKHYPPKMSYDKFLLAVESRDLSQADKSFI